MVTSKDDDIVSCHFANVRKRDVGSGRTRCCFLKLLPRLPIFGGADANADPGICVLRYA
jgi:hypothetical protein